MLEPVKQTQFQEERVAIYPTLGCVFASVLLTYSTKDYVTLCSITLKLSQPFNLLMNFHNFSTCCHCDRVSSLCPMFTFICYNQEIAINSHRASNEKVIQLLKHTFCIKTTQPIFAIAAKWIAWCTSPK